MENNFGQRRLIAGLISFAMFGAVVVRFIGDYWDSQDRYVMLGLLVIFALLLGTIAARGQGIGRWLHALIAGEVITIFFLFFYPKIPEDYFGILCVPVCGDAIFRLPAKTAYRWFAVTLLILGVDLYFNFPLNEFFPYWLTYIAASLFITAYARATLRAEEAKARSQALLTELTTAHQQLRAYAEQVEKLAASQERNRLARELHDSVTQTVFSMTLTAQAARMLLEKDPARAAVQLDRLQELASGALAEMRQLIQHLRPRTLAEEGLVQALRRHAAERLERDELAVDLQVEGEGRLPEPVEETLYRVSQEALNNVVKHAGTKQASIHLCLQGPVSLWVEDHGVGFDMKAIGSEAGHMGLAGMAERVRALGGTFSIDSSPGAGTRVRVENLPLGEIVREPHG